MKHFFWMIFLFSFLSLSADDFTRMKEDFEQVRSLWNDVDGLNRDAPRRVEFRNRLDSLKKCSLAVQKRIQSLGIGSDFRFPFYAEELSALARSRDPGGFKTGTRGTLSAAAEGGHLPAEEVFLLMGKDISELESFRFQMEGPAPVPPVGAAWNDLSEYRRLIHYALNRISALPQLSRNRDWYQLYMSRLDRALELAARLDKRFAEEIPELDTGIQLRVETESVLHAAREFVARGSSLDEFSLNTGKLKLGNDAGREKRERQAMRKDVALAKKQILARLREVEEQLRIRQKPDRTEKAADRTKPERAVRTPPQPEEKTPEAGKIRTVPVERMKAEQLQKKLDELREKTFPAPDAEEISPDQLARCLDTLSDGQRKLYDSIRAKMERQGKPADAIPLEALREVRELLHAPNTEPDRQEMIRILKRTGSSGE